ncbi:hypothetical protein [Niallia sp.]|uniref:hypothetical protein n=1 Tax=Niallia sp. TaxID=2837523 RepID=UPI00289ADE15|nr:hypothetical protein [Niallia sp.]
MIFPNSRRCENPCNEWGEQGNQLFFVYMVSTSLSFMEITEQLKENYKLIAINALGMGKHKLFLLENNMKWITW